MQHETQRTFLPPFAPPFFFPICPDPKPAAQRGNGI
jgi:hypothetical protein